MDENVVSWEELRKKIFRPRTEAQKQDLSKRTILQKQYERAELKARQEERRAKELARLEPVAIEKLEEHLYSPDPRIVQAAAKMILEHKWGRPTQKQELKAEQLVTKVVYETAAITYDEESA